MHLTSAELLRQLARGIDRLEVPFGSASMEALYGAVTATGLRRLLRDGSITVDEVADGLMRKISVGTVQPSSPRRSG